MSNGVGVASPVEGSGAIAPPVFFLLLDHSQRCIIQHFETKKQILYLKRIKELLLLKLK